ncbi:MAG: peptidoglycan DD-metalloendopeptidase family protein [Amaricoccus sp.]|uniref:murein hydrolase activator EnvC family protein n=1 Tax=Amaricoccus sp. TaxID=1872485 RepID=UPI0039E4F896
MAGVAAGPASAQTAAAEPADPLAAAAARISEASERIAAAGTALDAATSAPDQLAGLGRAIEAYDAALGVLRGGVAEAAEREQAIGVDLSDRRQEISRLLAALEAMSRTPQPAQAMHPLGPVGAAQAGAMMARLTPALQAQAAKLDAELAGLQAARKLRIAGETSLQAGLATLTAAQSRLSEAMTRAAPGEPGPDSPTATLLARDSATLSELASALAKSAGTAPPPAGAPATTPYAWPVDGAVLRHFNEPDAARVRHPGVVLTATPFALVSAPADAVVRYAGPFLEYGYVVVLEPDPETMIVLAGLAQLRVETGAAVRRGELLGVLGGRSPDAEEYVMQPESETGADTGETLYIEIRRDRGPIDPEPLFAKDNG